MALDDARIVLTGVPASDAAILAQDSTGFDLVIGASGNYLLTLEDSNPAANANTLLGNVIVIPAASASQIDKWFRIQVDANMLTRTATVRLDGATVWIGTFPTPGAAQFQSGRIPPPTRPSPAQGPFTARRPV